MKRLDEIGERIIEFLEEKNKVRDQALKHSRALIRHCSNAIRAVHRNERDLASKHLSSARGLAEQLREVRGSYPDLYFAGYTRDALKEFAEANIFYAIVGEDPLPDPDELGVEYDAYLGGLGEAVGEMRRRVLDALRQDEVRGAERLLEIMDDVYGYLVSVDFPSAITGNLRRTTDVVRGVTERTRGDLTTSIRQNRLKAALEAVKTRLDDQRKPHE
jgi:translin